MVIRSRSAADTLILDHLRWARAIAQRMVARARNVAPFDAESAAYEGLIHAARTWDPTGGASFRTWAAIAVRGRILDAWREHSLITRDELAAARRSGVPIERSMSGQDVADLDTAEDLKRPKSMPSSVSHEDQAAARIDLQRLLERLPPRLARVAMLRAEGYLLNEIAAELGVSEGRACQLMREIEALAG